MRILLRGNTPAVHTTTVCTLCSRHPRKLLGLPPGSYEGLPSRAVRVPRAVLAGFGTVLPGRVQLRVHDSTADMRPIVPPMHPAGTAGWDEAALAARVTRDSLIGVAQALSAEG